MSTQLCFWILMLGWLVFGFWQNGITNIKSSAGNLLLFILLALLGWRVFGAAIHN